jgi:flagellar biosynthesis component FlhA
MDYKKGFYIVSFFLTLSISAFLYVTLTDNSKFYKKEKERIEKDLIEIKKENNDLTLKIKTFNDATKVSVEKGRTTLKNIDKRHEEFINEISVIRNDGTDVDLRECSRILTDAYNRYLVANSR